MECLTNWCYCKPIARGLCKTCYYRLLRQVQRGTAKWGDLIASGNCKPARRYKGLTSAVRRENTLKTILRKKSLADYATPQRYLLPD